MIKNRRNKKGQGQKKWKEYWWKYMQDEEKNNIVNRNSNQLNIRPF